MLSYKITIPALFLSMIILGGCSPEAQRASLLPVTNNISSSIRDLDSSIVNCQTQKIYDEETETEYVFTYNNDDTNIIKKVTATSYDKGQKIINHYYITDEKVTYVSTEHHDQTNSKTKLTNHSFKVEDNKVTECVYQNAKILPSSDPKVQPMASSIESQIQYLYDTFLDSPKEDL